MSLFAKARIPKRRALPCCGVSPLGNLSKGLTKWDDRNQVIWDSIICSHCGHEHGYCRNVSNVPIIHAPIFKEHSS